ncbi:hypothetical protein NIES2135_64480 (plasmid) [Leptolyngbya boryana NIES-2135]|uniref:Uncharacterized protein n=1 Tax=Leptolyngbya boryana NIES-2135 TaxID=1973484 RepID=A0A1Z4JS24_LEPBY|nr:hypothetical protein NIES2135_64480 [Leptolyngbya boryana NIES-2135]
MLGVEIDLEVALGIGETNGIEASEGVAWTT